MAIKGVVSATITGEDSFTNQVIFEVGTFSISVYGTFVGAVTLQRTWDEGATWLDVHCFEEPEEAIADNSEEQAEWRIGVKTGDYTSGTISVRLSQ
jgi:hypothetical protein